AALTVSKSRELERAVCLSSSVVIVDTPVYEVNSPGLSDAAVSPNAGVRASASELPSVTAGGLGGQSSQNERGRATLIRVAVGLADGRHDVAANVFLSALREDARLGSEQER